MTVEEAQSVHRMTQPSAKIMKGRLAVVGRQETGHGKGQGEDRMGQGDEIGDGFK